MMRCLFSKLCLVLMAASFCNAGFADEPARTMHAIYRIEGGPQSLVFSFGAAANYGNRLGFANCVDTLETNQSSLGLISAMFYCSRDRLYSFNLQVGVPNSAVTFNVTDVNTHERKQITIPAGSDFSMNQANAPSLPNLKEGTFFLKPGAQLRIE